ncbi:uncharacterized protein DFL_007950 [Arthrobotrys flagrans]|uniref:Ricin B lectin domain-containing protein n=1 Tax=Arthrobotrys flagrans TaxID=97331 RepID=A0A436ZXU8_ARTFL|nr:hypothetical protein DFL_007950 [Arthrobotrys flagrans]
MNLIISSALMVAFIPSTLFSQSVADPVIPDGDYFLLWTSWPDRYLTGSNKATYDKTGLVDVTFQPKSYSSWETRRSQQWRIKNRSDGTVYIQNVWTYQYLGSGHKFNCSVPATDKTNCATSLLDFGERFKLVEHYARKGRYLLQLDGYGGSLWQPTLGPAGPANKPLETAMMTHSYYGRDMTFEFEKV